MDAAQPKINKIEIANLITKLEQQRKKVNILVKADANSNQQQMDTNKSKNQAIKKHIRILIDSVSRSINPAIVLQSIVC